MRYVISICLGATLLSLLFPAAMADVIEGVIVLDTGYARGPAGWEPGRNWPNIGDPLVVVGYVVELNDPLPEIADLNVNCEVTYAFESYSCDSWGMWDDFANHTGGWFVAFTGGQLSIYCDESPDATFSDVETFSDGELMLRAESTVLVFGEIPTQWGYFQFTGGSLFDRVSRDGVGYLAENYGAFGGQVPEALRTLGYIGQSQGRIDIQSPVATEQTSWGRIKALFQTNPSNSPLLPTGRQGRR